MARVTHGPKPLVAVWLDRLLVRKLGRGYKWHIDGPILRIYKGNKHNEIAIMSAGRLTSTDALTVIEAFVDRLAKALLCT